MTNPYLKHTKFGAGCGSHNIFSTAASYWSKKGLTEGLTEFSEQSGLQDAFRQGTIPNLTGTPVVSTGSKIKSGTDGWAEYFWDTKKKVVTFIHPSSGKKVTVKPKNSAYKAITTKVNWVDSTESAMKKQKEQAPKVTAVAPISEDLALPEHLFPAEKKGIVDKTITYAKENPVIAGGIGLGVATVLGLTGMLFFGGSGNQEMVYIMTDTGETIGVPGNTIRYTYNVEFQDDEKYGPYVVKPIKMTASDAKINQEVTWADKVSARRAGQESVEAFRRNMRG